MFKLSRLIIPVGAVLLLGIGTPLTTGVAVFSRADDAQAILGVTIKLS